LKLYSITDVGLVRKSNQDCVVTREFSENISWAIVCDGVGGANGGDVASRLAIGVISDFFESFFKNSDASAKQTPQISESTDVFFTEGIKSAHLGAIKLANSKIYVAAKNDKNLRGMGTTVVMSVLCGSTLHTSHVGDSRAYLVSQNKIYRLTTDHSVVQEMIEKGEITENEAHSHPRKNLITKALGIDKTVSCDYGAIKVDSGDIVLLCTDGLTDYLKMDDIKNIILENNEIEISAKKFVDTVKNLGGADNVTVSIMQI
jgi:protein phosphatase